MSESFSTLRHLKTAKAVAEEARVSKRAVAEIPESELIRMISEGQTQLFEALVAEHVPKICGLALTKTDERGGLAS